MKKNRIHKLVRTARTRITALYTGGVLGVAVLLFAIASTIYIGHAFALFQQSVALDGGGGGSYSDYPTRNLPADTAPPTSTTNITSTYTNSNGQAAGRSTWGVTLTATMWYAWNRGTLPSSDTTTTGWATGLANPSISIGYDYSVYDFNNPSTIINPGSSVQSGQKVILKFNPYTSDNIFWFGTGSSMDSPYGEWRAGAAAPARVGNNVTCVSKDLVQQYTYTNTYDSSSIQFDVYIPFVVNPPDRSLSSLNGLSCGALTTNSDGSQSAVCTVTATSGSISPSFNYTATNGIFYYRYYDYRDMTASGWGGPGCYGNNIALTSGDISGFGNPTSPSANSSTSIAPPLVVSIPAESYAYPLSITPPTNTAPNAPTVSCSPSPVNINTDVNVTLTATDPQSDNVSYGVDWTGGSTVNSGWTGFVTSGTSQTITKTGGFASPGTYTVTGFAKDTGGLQSPGSSCTFTVRAPAPTVSLTATPGAVNPGGSATLSWTSTGATSCTGTNFSTGGATSGSASTGALSTTQMYSVSCTGPGGNATDSAQVTVNAAADLTAGSVSLSNGAPVAGNGVSLTASAQNIGSSPSGSFPVLFQVQTSAGTDVSLVDSPYVAGLPVGASAPASISYTFASAGTYQVRACANYNTSWTAITSESNYANNCGGWTPVTVAAPAPTGALSCTVDNTNPTSGTTIHYTVTPSSGATGPYTWNDTQGGSYGTGPTASRLITSSTGNYVMTVSGQNVATQPVSCPVVTAGCGTPSGTITANPTRVRANDTTTPITLTWSASGVNTSCTVSGPGVNQTVPANSCNVGTQTARIPSISVQSVYTLTCGGTPVARAIVNVIPSFQEF